MVAGDRLLVSAQTLARWALGAETRNSATGNHHTEQVVLSLLFTFQNR